MSPEELNRILAAEDGLEPSSGFAERVMLAVREDATQPAERRFPWWRFGIGIAASGVAAAMGTAMMSESEIAVPAVSTEAVVTAATLFFTAAVLGTRRFLRSE